MNKLVKRLVGLALAATMVVGMGVVSFAAGNSGAYSVKYLDANGNETMGAASLVGADVEYDELFNETTITIYTQYMKATVQATGQEVYGWVDGIAIKGVTATRVATSNVTETGEVYPSAFRAVLSGDYSEIPASLSCDISVNVNGYNHAVQDGTLVIETR